MADSQLVDIPLHRPMGHASDDSRENIIRETIRASIEAKEKLFQIAPSSILRMADIISEALSHGRKVLVFGNGGSAADAQHFAAELVGQFRRPRQPLRVMALTTNTSVLTAIGNDIGFEDVFSRQVRAYADKGDVIVAISTSGRSKNVLKALKEATDCGATTIGLTGGTGGDLGSVCDHCIIVPSRDVQRIQECHILVSHIVCDLVEQMIA